MDLSNDRPYMCLETFALRSYSAKQIEKLSVVEINRFQTFDSVSLKLCLKNSYVLIGFLDGACS